MTCFRLNQNKTVHQWCVENGIPYGSVYNYLEKGMKPAYACRTAKKKVGQLYSHPKIFYKGKPIVEIFKDNKNKYTLVLKRIREGMKIETAVEKSLKEVR